MIGTAISPSTYQFVRAEILRQVPLFDTAGLITRNELPLIGMHTYVVDCLFISGIIDTKEERDTTGGRVVVCSVQLGASVVRSDPSKTLEPYRLTGGPRF